MYDLDELLTRAHRLERENADSFLTHALRKGAGHVEAHVGFEQYPAHLAEPLSDVVLGEDPAAGELPERGGEALGERGEHKANNYKWVMALPAMVPRHFAPRHARRAPPGARGAGWTRRLGAVRAWAMRTPVGPRGSVSTGGTHRGPHRLRSSLAPRAP